MKRFLSLLLVAVLAFTLAACQKENYTSTSGNDDGTKNENTGNTDTGNVNTGSGNIGTDPITVIMEVKGFGTMKLELYPEIAPITVENFVNYVNDGFYDGLTFHRIYKGFMIQGGNPDGTGSGGQNLTPIKGEFALNGVENTISHTRGTISMARTSQSMDSATSQFFICDADSTFLDRQYAAFGKLIEGYDVLDAIAGVEVQMNMWGEMSDPVEDVIIEKVYVEK